MELAALASRRPCQVSGLPLRMPCIPASDVIGNSAMSSIEITPRFDKLRTFHILVAESLFGALQSR